MVNFQPFSGIVTMIDNFSIGQNNEVGCYKLISVDNGQGTSVNFVVAPNTYFVDHAMVAVRDRVTGFYDANAPAPLIFPPQFGAIVMAKDTPNQHVKVDFFNSRLESRDGTLRLTISPYTQILYLQIRIDRQAEKVVDGSEGAQVLVLSRRHKREAASPGNSIDEAFCDEFRECLTNCLAAHPECAAQLGIGWQAPLRRKLPRSDLFAQRLGQHPPPHPSCLELIVIGTEAVS